MTRHRRLNRIAAGLAVLLTGLAASTAAAQPATDLAAVQAASKAFYVALAVLDDGSAMAKVWANRPYVTFVGPASKSVVVGWDDQRKYWQDNNSRTALREPSLTEAHIHVNGNLAWEIGTETGRVQRKGGEVGEIGNLVTNIYEKIDGQWLMVSHHAQPRPR